jgi:hypothetical protein
VRDGQLPEIIKQWKSAAIPSALIVMFAVLATPRLADLIIACGHDIPQEDLATDYFRGLTWALLLWLSILIWPVSRRNRNCLLVAWGAKIVITLGLMLFYENSYGLDAYMYFDESRYRPFSFATFTTSGNAGSTWNVVNLVAVQNIFLPASYHAEKVTFAMLGLVAVYVFYRSAVLFLGREDRRIFYLMAFFPGILFWSSTLGKEPVVFIAIALYAYGVVTWYCRRTLGSFLLVIVGVVIGLYVRVWLAPIMVVPLLILFLKAPGNRLVKLFLVPLTLIALVFSAGPMMEKFRIEAFSDVLTAAEKTTQGFVNTGGGSTQQVDVDLTSPAGAAKFLPQAAFTALFRPLPGEVMNPFGLLAGLESALLLGLLMVAIRRTKLRELGEPLVLWCGSFILIWSLVNGIVSSTNFGVAVRYKLQVLPMLLGLLIYLARERKRDSIAADETAAEIPLQHCATATAAAAMTGESRTGG